MSSFHGATRKPAGPSNGRGTSGTYQTSETETRFDDLKRDHDELRNEVATLKTLCSSLMTTLEALEKSAKDAAVGPVQDDQTIEVQKKVDAPPKVSPDGAGNDKESKAPSPAPSPAPRVAPTVAPSVASSTPNGVPPHLRSKTKSVPPHLRKAASVVTEKPHVNGETPTKSEPVPNADTEAKQLAISNADTGAKQLVIPNDATPTKPVPAHNETATKKVSVPNGETVAKTVPVSNGVVENRNATAATQTQQPTPPASPAAKPEADGCISPATTVALTPAAIESWKPYYLTTLPVLGSTILNKIPPPEKMTTFHADFLRNTFGGFSWSPGLNWIPPSPSPCILANRTYFTLEDKYDPYIPSRPGEHGAKLVPFFNENVEEHYALPKGFPSTSDNVPVFIMRKDANGHLRYTYSGHYSQSRWSDRLDYDCMLHHVPKSVLAFWAGELACVGRPEWLSEALRKHFFPKPELPGELFGMSVNEMGSISSDDVGAAEEKARKVVEQYVKRLRRWDENSRRQLAALTKEDILEAFDAADAAYPPALRLYWEYLECVDWKEDFYKMLVALQARSPCYKSR